MFDKELGKYVCDGCNEGKTDIAHIQVANVIFAEACETCRPAFIKVIRSLHTQQAHDWYTQLERGGNPSVDTREEV